MKKAKKYLHILLILPTLLILFALPAQAEGESSEDLIKASVEDVLEDFENALPDGMSDLTDTDAVTSCLGFDAIVADVIAAVEGNLGRVGGFLALLLGTSAVMVAATLVDGENAPLVRGAVALVGGVGITASLIPLINEVSASLSGLGEAFSSLAPVMVSVLALGGGTASATVSGSGMALTLMIYGALCEALVPLVTAMLALGVVSSFLPDGFGSVYTTVRNWFVRGLGIVTALLGGTIALQGVITSASDSAALRLAKQVASGSIPAVGSAVSGALSTLSGGISYLGGIIGGGTVAVILLTALSPLVLLLLYKLCFFFASLLLEHFGVSEAMRTVSAISSALESLIAVYASATVIYLLEAIVFVRMVVTLV